MTELASFRRRPSVLRRYRPRDTKAPGHQVHRRAASRGACYTRPVHFPKTKIGRGVLGAAGGAAAFIAIGQLYALVGSS